MADEEILGATASWHIRSMPEAVRQAIVDRAHAERCSVAELLTRLLLVDAVAHAPTEVNAVLHAVDLARLSQMAQIAKDLGIEVPDRVKRSIGALIGHEARSQRRAQRALPAPERGRG